MYRSFLFFLLSIAIFPATNLAQRDGPKLQWDQEIIVSETTMNLGDTVLPAYMFMVFEADRNKVMEMWRNDLSTKNATIVKGEPMVASNAMISALSASPIRVVAVPKEDRKTGNTSLSIAFRSTDTIPSEKAKAYARELAVKYNRGVVEAQIAEEEKQLEKARGMLGKSESKDNKLKATLQKKESELNKLEAARTKQQKKNAEIQGDIAGAEQKYAITRDVKDLKKLTKYRSKLADGETKVAKIMEKEAKLQGSIGKTRGDLPGSADAKDDQVKHVGDHEKRIEALRSKLTEIR